MDKTYDTSSLFAKTFYTNVDNLKCFIIYKLQHHIFTFNAVFGPPFILFIFFSNLIYQPLSTTFYLLNYCKVFFFHNEHYHIIFSNFLSEIYHITFFNMFLIFWQWLFCHRRQFTLRDYFAVSYL